MIEYDAVCVKEAPESPAPSLLLASSSPRRRALLRLVDLPFEVAAVDVDERVGPGESAPDVAGRLARTKALAGGRSRPDRIVLAADTVVELDDQPLGKPIDEAEARAMLRALRGRPHRVITGLALARGPELRWSGAVESVVRMRPYANEEIERYVASGGPLDKAGGYAVQAADFRPAEGVDGCYPNVVGLPLCEALRGLEALGPRAGQSADDLSPPPCQLCERARELVW
ncbi:MAG: septum formation protein Maf [Chloroflexi bacterium]|nr:septum formation protein Maf [Chloroflexota bacterium]